MSGNNSSHLSSGTVNLGLLREHARRELLKLLDKCSGSKVSFFSNFRVYVTQTISTCRIENICFTLSALSYVMTSLMIFVIAIYYNLYIGVCVLLYCSLHWCYC